MLKMPIYLVVGVPGSGKSWVCEQLKDDYTYVHHDGFIYLKQPGAYVQEVLKVAGNYPKKPLLIEAPFSVSETVKPLEAHGYRVIPVYIIEDPQVVSARYMKREGRFIPPGHLTRMQTYKLRAEAQKAFHGTSTEVYNHLKSLAEARR